MTVEEEREACRALKGSMLRQEVYADDADHPGATQEQIQRARRPYTVTEQNFTIRTLQALDNNRHAVFFTHARESLSYHYERDPTDPRIQHALTLEVDNYGNVLKQAAIGYGRRVSPLSTQWDRVRQTTPLLTYSENRVTNPIDSPDTHRNPLPCEAVTFELTGYTTTGPAGRYQASDFVEPDPATPGRLRHRFTAPEVAYEVTATGNQRRRPIEQLRTLYRRDDLGSLLPLGELHPLALPGESYKLAITPGSLDQVYVRGSHRLMPANPASVLAGAGADRGGYVDLDNNGHWWIPSGRMFHSPDSAHTATQELAYAQQHFFLPHRYRDPFHTNAVRTESVIKYDGYDLLIVESLDAVGNRVTVGERDAHGNITVPGNDYRVLQPKLVMDPNRNRAQVAFDTLGMVAGTAIMGKPLPDPVEGDTLTGFVADLTQAELDQFMAAPRQPSLNPKESEATQVVHDLLRGATTRIVYDLDRFMRLGEPPFAGTIARESHVSELQQNEKSKLQISFSYSDGFGREIQKKIQAEPGPIIDGGPIVNPRWVGSGWSIFNNKGKPVRQYEPFFTATHDFEFGVMAGVSPVLFYDPAERVIATLHPNHSYEKVVFDPWQQTTYDVNDTCAPRPARPGDPRPPQTGDPRTDPDIGGYVAEYFKTQPATWQTWHAQRIGGALGQDERNAAQRAAVHADTPSTAHFDALGRPFLTVARNRVVCPGHNLDGTEESFDTRVELDIEGNQRAVRDAVTHTEARDAAGNPVVVDDPLGRIVMRYAYDMLGNRIHQLSMEAGARWMLKDVAGKPIRAWDSRGHEFSHKYDPLRRPVEQTVRGTTPDSDPRTLGRDRLVDKIQYGESLAIAESLNLRTRIYKHSDSAGVATNARLDFNDNPIEAYDFKGNLLRSTRRLVTRYWEIPDWSQNPPPQLESEFFESSTRYDALNRPIQSLAPHSSLTRVEPPNKFNVIQPIFNEANLLERVNVWLERGTEPGALLDPAIDAPSRVGVANIDYDAKGQRQRIDYKNGASTFYDYDPLTFRLTHLYTRRGASFIEDCDNPNPPPLTIAASDTPPQGKACGVQNLHYTYDPVGNITHIQDDAQQTIYFRNKRVEPSNDYTYDAIYRLIQASGREHLGQLANGDPKPPTAPDAFNDFHTRQDHPNVLKAIGAYIERYVYDAVGNFLQMQHRGSDPAHAGWTRAYVYHEASLIEDGIREPVRKTSNRLTSTTVNPAGNTPQPEAYQHDAHGNMVRMPHLGVGLPGPNMHWDYKDQLRRTDLGGGGAAFYVYDASGQRVRKVWEKSPALTEERIYLGGFEIFRKHNGPIGDDTATLERGTLHVMDDKQRIALVETRTLPRTPDPNDPLLLIRYQFGNHLGSASLELDEQAQIISYEEYSPYGSSTYQAVRSQTETAKRYRYTGKERDEETGLYYYGARYYAAWLGRWSSYDPVFSNSRTNLYVYADCRPVILFDPNGRAPFTAPLLPPTAPGSPPLPPAPGLPLRGLPGGGMGDGIPRGALRLVPAGQGAVGSAGAGTAIVTGAAVVAAAGSVALLGATIHSAASGEPTPIDVADKFYGTHFGDIVGWVQGRYASSGPTPPAPAPTAPAPAAPAPAAPAPAAPAPAAPAPAAPAPATPAPAAPAPAAPAPATPAPATPAPAAPAPAPPTPAPTTVSPAITPDELRGKTEKELHQLAKDKGLVQDPKKSNRYRDPVTGKERLRIDPGHKDSSGKPYDDPRAAGPHAHGYDPSGKIDVTDPLTKSDPKYPNNKHFPIKP
jgi:RHS repeat-associated protein